MPLWDEYGQTIINHRWSWSGNVWPWLTMVRQPWSVVSYIGGWQCPGPRPGHIKSSFGAKRVIFCFFSLCPRPRHIKSRYGANGLFSIIFSLSPRPGHIKSRCRANGSFSVIFSPGPKLGHIKSWYGANGVHESQMRGKLVICCWQSKYM